MISYSLNYLVYFTFIFYYWNLSLSLSKAAMALSLTSCLGASETYYNLLSAFYCLVLIFLTMVTAAFIPCLSLFAPDITELPMYYTADSSCLQYCWPLNLILSIAC